MMIIVTGELAKSYVSAHSRTIPSGKVIQIKAHNDRRSKKVEPGEDSRTPDMFRPPSKPAPKRDIPDECARNPEKCTPDLFNGKTELEETQKVGAGETVVPDGKPNPSAVSGELAKMGRDYHQIVPIKRALDVAAKHGLHGVDDDGSPWEGMLTGRDGRATIDLADSSGKVVNGMAIQWHKMDGSGKYEFNAYLTGAVMHKSQPRILFIKSHVKQFTRKDGTIVKEHDDKRTKKAEAIGPGRKPGAPDEGKDPEDIRGSAHGYGTHNIEEGDALKFKAGDFEGSGKVKSVGKDGAVVTDESGRDHNVHWHEVSGFKKDDGGGDKKPPEDAQGKPAGDEQGKHDGKPEKASRKFFDPAEVEKMPHKDTVAQTVFKSWSEAEKLAPAAHEEYTSLLKGMGEKIGFQPGRGSPDKMSDADLDSEESFIFMGPIKQEGKSTKKVNSDYKGDWTKLKDLVRATIAVKSIDDVHSALEGLKGAGLEFAQKPKDNMTNGTRDGYRDLNLILKLPESGMLVELQIAVKQISKVKGDAHHYYNENVALDQKRKEAWGAIESSGNGVSEPSQRYNHDDEESASNWPSQADYKAFMANRKKQQEIYGGAWSKVPGIDRILKSLLCARGKMILFFKGAKHVH